MIELEFQAEIAIRQVDLSRLAGPPVDIGRRRGIVESIQRTYRMEADKLKVTYDSFFATDTKKIETIRRTISGFCSSTISNAAYGTPLEFQRSELDQICLSFRCT